MINYEGIEFNLDSIIQLQFHSLKKLLEAFAKKQLEHSILFFGQNNNFTLNNYDNENPKTTEGKDENESNENESNKNIYIVNKSSKIIDNEKKPFYDKVNNSGLINEYIETHKQLIEHKQLIDELRKRIEALENYNEEKSVKNNNINIKEDIKKEKVNKSDNSEPNINKSSSSDKIDNNQNIDNENIINNNDINEEYNIIEKDKEKDKNINIIDNEENKMEKESKKSLVEIKNSDIQKEESPMLDFENKIIKNYNSTTEENYIKTQINTFEEDLRIIKEKMEKMLKETEINKKSIELSHNELIQFKTQFQKLNDQNITKSEKERERIGVTGYNFEKLEKKIMDLMEQKFRLNKISDNNTIKELNSEQEKLKEENEKIINDVKDLLKRTTDIEDKIVDLPNILAIRKIEEKIKILGIEMEDCATKKDIKHICDELDKYEKELSKLKSFVVSQNETNEKYREEILKLKNSFDTVRKTFSSINKIFENNSLAQLLANLNDLSKSMVDKEEYNKFVKDIKRKISDIQMDVNQHNRHLDEIMPVIQKILTSDDLNKLENSLTGLIEKQNADALGKFADKKEIIKSIKSIESQVKIFMKNLDKEREKEKNDSVILASKPVGGYKCASCEAYIGELKDSYTYLPWNKYHGSERPYRLGSSFSRILQGLNIENTFNPFIHKNLLQSENSKKFQMTNNCLSVKKVKKITTLAHVPSEHDMIKEKTIDEPFNLETNPNKRYQYPNMKNMWGNKTLRTAGNETTYWTKNKPRDINFKNQQIKGIEKMFKVSKKVIKTKHNNNSEDYENHYYMPNL